MPSVYSVTAADVAAELPGLFPVGFSVSTRPTADMVDTFLAAADAIAALRVRAATFGRPGAGVSGYQLARRYVIDSAKAQVLAVVYTGNDPLRVADAIRPYRESMAQILAAIDSLTPAAAEDTAGTVLTGDIPTRAMLVTDDDLDACSGRRGRY